MVFKKDPIVPPFDSLITVPDQLNPDKEEDHDDMEEIDGWGFPFFVDWVDEKEVIKEFALDKVDKPIHNDSNKDWKEEPDGHSRTQN